MREYTLPWAVLASTNHRTNPAGWGRMKGRQFLTRRYRAARYGATLLVRAYTKGAAFTGAVAVSIRFWLPDKRRRDPGNLTKLIEDALMHGGAMNDDSQIQRMTWEVAGIDRADPRAEVVVRQLDAAAS